MTSCARSCGRRWNARARSRSRDWSKRDEVYLGGVREGKIGRGAAGKTPFAEGLETPEERLPNGIKLRTAASFRLNAIESRCRRNVSPGSKLNSDGPSCFGEVAPAGWLLEG